MGFWKKDPYVDRADKELHRNSERERKQGTDHETSEYQRLNAAAWKQVRLSEWERRTK